MVEHPAMCREATGKQRTLMRIFMLTYTVLMLAGSAFTLGLVPRALRDLGHERERLATELPGVEFKRMVNAGYHLNALLLMVEVLFYYLLLRYTGPEWQFFYGGFFFGIIHIGYLIMGRVERRRLADGSTRTRFARLLIWVTALLTGVEIPFLLLVSFLLLGPAPD